jgi:hypothetical protein
MNSSKIDFSTFIFSVSGSAMMSLGLLPEDFNPAEVKSSTQTNDKPKMTNKNLALAKHNIDLLELMQDKTRGNLTPDEAKLLEQVLFELRMRYVEAQK